MKLLCIGDYIEDRYVFGTATRLCPEAPVPVIVPHEWRESPGGAGLVTEQLRILCSEDVLARYGSHCVKTRYFAGNHLVCRVDEQGSSTNWERAPLEPSLSYADAIVVADYGRAVSSDDGAGTNAMTQEIAQQIVSTGKPCFVDAKNHWHWYAGPNVTIFPNDREAQAPLFPPDPTQVIHSCEYQRVVHKLGRNGCRLNEKDLELTLPATVSEVVDVTGAGDIFMAAFVYAWSIQLPTDRCLEFANILAGESCRHVGTWTAPKAFAEAVLDRLRASRASAAPSPDCSPGSNRRAHPLSPEQDQAQTLSSGQGFDSRLEDSQLVGAGTVADPQILRRVQTHLESPSGPTGLPGAPTPSDQETIDVPGKRWPKKPQIQSPNEF